MTFVFRNNTIEPFFKGEEYTFSGYADISVIPAEAHAFVWFYQLPVLATPASQAAEVAGYIDMLRLVVSQVPADKSIIVLSMVDTTIAPVVISDRSVADAVAKYNSDIVELASTNVNVKVLDFNDFCKQYPVEQLVDLKFLFISQMPLNPKLMKPFASWWQSKMRVLQMKRKKCLVLDLDNTLWGGILGEDGIDGIKIGGDYPGKAFAWWQKQLFELSQTGVLLAICSKNNLTDVKDAWQKNPYLILKEKDFVAYRINWNDKASNIREIAEELNIGLDSLVFIDDNPTERELVRQMLPMVEVPDFPAQPYLLPDFFNSLVENYFQVYSLTGEDLHKTEQYKANALRNQARNSFSNMTDYLRSLEICIDILPADSFSIPRIAQMTQKTNQFNLTTRRYTDDDVRRMLDRGWYLWCISVADKFGDNGITGCIFITPDGHIDTFLLSCRILGKGIESAFFYSVLNQLKDKGFDTVTAEFLPSKKNAQVAEFYPGHGFAETQRTSEGVKYTLNLTDFAPQIPDYYKITIK